MDIDTLAIVGALLSLLVVAVLTLTLRSAPSGSRPSVRVWIAATALLCGYWLLFGYVEGDGAEGLRSLANSLVLLALLGYLQAIRVFTRRRLHWRPWTAVAVTAVAASVWFDLVQDSHPMRVLVASAFTAALLAWMIGSLRGRSSPHGGDARRFLQVMAALGVALVLLRLAAHLLAPEQPWDLAGRLLVLLYLALFPAFAGFAFLLMHSDRANAELERLAGTDPLTGALNRRALEQIALRILSEARRHRRPVALLMVDADHFKLVNDTYGHEAGDVVLCQLLERIGETLRQEDAIGRFGGEEFVVLLPGTPLGEAVQAAERIRLRVGERNFLHEGEEIPLTVSIGVAERNPGEASFEALLRRADDAMYAAKRAGRNRVVAAEREVAVSAA